MTSEERAEQRKTALVLILAFILITICIGLLILFKKRRQNPQTGIFKYVKQMFTRWLDSYRARRQAPPVSHSPGRDETEEGTELTDLGRRRGSRSSPRTQRGVVAENQGSESNPEDTGVDGTHGQDPRGTWDNIPLTEPPPAALSFDR